MKRSFALLLTLTVFAQFSLAQTPPTPRRTPNQIPGLPPAGGDNSEPAAQVPLPGGMSGNATGELDPDAIAVPAGQTIEFPKATGLDVAGMVWDYSRKRVILSSAAKDVEIFFVQRGPMTNREVMKILKAALAIEGLALIEDQQDPTIVRLLPSTPVTNPDSIPKAYIDDPLDLPTSDELVTYRMQFKALDPEEALRIFQSVIGDFGPGGKISAVKNASSVIVTANSSLVRQLLKIKEDIDKGSLVEDRWVHITYADVDEIAQQLNEIYNQQRSGSSSSTRTRRSTGTPAVPGLPGGGAPNAGGGGGNPGEDIPINIIPDTRTSRLLIIGRPSDLDSVEKLIKSYDVPSDPRTAFRYQLRYLRVGEFIPIATQAIERTLGSQSQGGGAGGSRRLGGSTNNNQTNRNNNRGNNNTGNRTGGGGGGGGGASIQAQDVPTEPTAETVGKTLLVADNVANAVIVQGPPHHIEIVKNLIKELDTASQQIVISAVIGSYSLRDSMNFGVDLAQLLTRTGGEFQLGGSTAFGGAGIIEPGSLESFADLLAARGDGGSGVSLYGFLDDEFGVFVNALEGETNFKVLERPVITTRNNRVATLTSGRRIAVPSSSFSGGAANGTTTNVEFRDVVLELEIQPLINSNNEVTLEISLVRDTLASGSPRTIGSGPNPLSVQDIISETLTSSVTVANGSTIVLGGLITDRNSNEKSGVPILSRVPGLGRLFGSTSKATDREELVVLLRPEIINGTSDFAEHQRRFENDATIARDARKSLPRTSAGMLPPQGEIVSDQSSGKSGLSLKTTKKKKTWFKSPSNKNKRRRPLGGRGRR